MQNGQHHPFSANSVCDALLKPKLISVKQAKEILSRENKKIVEDLRKGLDWFREHNPKAYMVLLD